MAGWGGPWDDDAVAAEQAAARAAYEAQQHTPFERDLLDALAELIDAVGEKGKPGLGDRQVSTVEFDRAAEQLAIKHTDKPYPFWAGVVRDVLAAFQWTPDADPAGRGGELTQPAQEASASAGPADPLPGPARPDLAAMQDMGAKAAHAAEFFPQHTQGTAPPVGDATDH